jgi:SNF2 family DNA or RNA helicase
MSLSSIVKKRCPTCNKIAVEKSRINFGERKLISLECGHLIPEEAIAGADYSSVVSSDGKRLMPYQIDGVKFVEASGARCLIADEQGLGKTIQAVASLSLHKNDLTPTLIVTKTTIKLQWMWEVFRWIDTKKVQVIQTSKEIAIPGFDVYIVTYDILKNENVFAHVELKSLILDECQAIKNHLSGRAKAVQNIAKLHNIEHIIGLSGTPIKNNAGEYFTILNLLQPLKFPEYNRYIRTYCDSYETMYGYKVGGLVNPDFFHEQTKDFIIRRTKDEVLKDLPELSRRFHHVELKKELHSSYNKALAELEELMYADEDSQESMTATIAILTRLRQICGISKVTEAVDFTTDFLLSTDRKLVIFVHHKAVASLLEDNLNQWLKDGNYPSVLNLTAELSGDQRAQMVKTFAETNARVMIASTLAAGEGLNLQFCSDAIMLERQWNPANEEQAEARFHRFGQKNNVTITYMLATETIDEYFTELVEQKRAIVASTLDNKTIEWDQNSLMKELTETLIRKGKKAWKL